MKTQRFLCKENILVRTSGSLLRGYILLTEPVITPVSGCLQEDHFGGASLRGHNCEGYFNTGTSVADSLMECIYQSCPDMSTPLRARLSLSWQIYLTQILFASMTVLV